MKRNIKFLGVLLITALCFSSCNKSTSNPGGSGSVPSNGWRIGTNNYTTFFAMRNVGMPNSIGAFDALPSANNINTATVIFNNISGIAAGTFKVVLKPNQSDLLANEIMIAAGTGYNQTTGHYDKEYVTVLGETVNATVTITGGKATVVIPQINIISYPITASSTATNFAGTIVEQ